MNRLTRILLLLLLPALGGIGQLKSQSPCMLNPSDTTFGVHPSDTLPDFFYSSIPITEVVQYVVKADTTVFGMNFLMDSALAFAFIGLPAGMQVSCQSSPAPCWDYRDPGSNRLRFCFGVTMDSIFTTNPAYPLYDSIGVVCDYYMYIPFIGTYIMRDTTTLLYRTINWADSFGDGLQAPATIEAMLTPNPTTGAAQLDVWVTLGAPVEWTLCDALGRRVMAQQLGTLPVGKHRFPIETAGLPDGVYFLTVTEGEARRTFRMVQGG